MNSHSLPPVPADLDLLDRVARAVARARRLSPADVDDFAQAVHVRMAERHYDVFTRYEGRASLRTYLTVVVARLLKDWQNHEYGKWRPSSATVRLGAVAVMLDRAVNRDGLPVNEAVQLVATSTGRPEQEVAALAALVPRRAKRRLVPLDAVGQYDVAHHEPPMDDDASPARAAARRALAQALAAVPRGDARLFVARYLGKTSVATLARAESVDAKALYRRFDRIKKALRARIVAQGVRDASCAW